MPQWVMSDTLKTIYCRLYITIYNNILLIYNVWANNEDKLVIITLFSVLVYLTVFRHTVLVYIRYIRLADSLPCTVQYVQYVLPQTGKIIWHTAVCLLEKPVKGFHQTCILLPIICEYNLWFLKKRHLISNSYLCKQLSNQPITW